MTTICWPRGTGAAQAWATTMPSTPSPSRPGLRVNVVKIVQQPYHIALADALAAGNQRFVMPRKGGNGKAVALNHRRLDLSARPMMSKRLSVWPPRSLSRKRRIQRTFPRFPCLHGSNTLYGNH